VSELRVQGRYCTAKAATGKSDITRCFHSSGFSPSPDTNQLELAQQPAKELKLCRRLSAWTDVMMRITIVVNEYVVDVAQV